MSTYPRPTSLSATVSLLAIGLGAAGGVSACSSEPETTAAAPVPNLGKKTGISLKSLTELVDSNGGAPVIVSDGDGREWSVKRAQFALPAALAAADVAHTPSITASARLDVLSDEDAADRMRALRLVGELEFTETQPNVARLKSARERNAAGNRLRADPHDPSLATDPDSLAPVAVSMPPAGTGSTLQRSSGLFVGQWRDFLGAADDVGTSAGPANSPFASDVVRTRSNPLARVASGLITPDGELNSPMGIQGLYTRSWVTTVWGWPHGAIVKHSPSIAAHFGAGGTATLIGRRTAIGAAHSFHNLTGWNATREWAADIIKYTPLGGSSITENVFGVYYGCYSVTIPIGYISTGGSDEEDFAVLEFTCGLSPGNYTGWIPGGVGTANDIYTSNTYLEGYDYGPPLPSTLSGGRVYAIGSMLTRYGSAYSARVKPGAVSLIQHWLDTTPGASGSGLLKNLFWSLGDGTYYWSGVHASGLDQSFNLGRRNDWGLWYFITDNTSEW